MKLSYAAFLWFAVVGECQAFLTSSSTRERRIATTVGSSHDAAFSAFADSLEEEPEKEVEKSWQAKLEDLLAPQTNLADVRYQTVAFVSKEKNQLTFSMVSLWFLQRQILLSDLLNSNEAIRESVLDAFATRKVRKQEMLTKPSRTDIDPLLTPTGKKLQDGTRAVARQIANDILPQLSKDPPRFPPPPSSLEKVGTRFFDVVSNQLQKNFEDLQQDLSDPINRIPQRLTKQTEDFIQEARNVFLETPEGLQEPKYTVVESCDLYELREYESYTVASTVMDEGEDLASTGNAFNSLASYLFGLNEASKTMAMTTPVTTTSFNEMRFYLAETAIPEPSADSTIEIFEVPSALLAVRKFTGFVTDGEIARQKDTLLQALEMDGVALDVPHGAVVPHVVFQYNPPYTLPIVRRNEIAVPVRRVEEKLGGTSLREEWSVDDAGGMEDELSDSSLEDQNKSIEVNEDTSPSD
eukprot:scaffold1722_cov120-Cylindrotheca_fusiformis.AAC.15